MKDEGKHAFFFIPHPSSFTMSLRPPNVTFYQRARQALNDPQLHIALDRATDTLTTLRSRTMGTFVDGDALRDQARMIRAHTLSRLDHYLAQFADAVEAAGGRVHWALDGAAANQIVLDIARAHGVKTAVKGKSMVTEETGLNHVLQSAGIDVIETDLGERIIQLAGETPSHIIAPAIHKTKEQVGRLFHEKLGAPLTDVPEEMTAVARQSLRHDFLRADMGISGVNFGVAETGTLALVENEGNGRLTATAPRIHVAFMGIERLVPTIADLEVMLQVLARSATGQKLSVYTNLLTGPRRPGEPDGPDELHVVLVDNGRSRVLGGKLAEILYCIRCGACLNACPVYRQIGGHAYGGVYTGPIGAVLSPALDGLDPWSELPHASSLCGACREVCPVGIDIPRMLLELRHAGHEQGKSPWWLKIGLRMYRIVATRPLMFKWAIATASAATRLVARSGWVRRLPPPLSGWTDYRNFPAFAREPFSTQVKRRRLRLGTKVGLKPRA
ncbi:MAG TPA: LutB/LldF family L-lactate oxidation iron-sulfur protein [Anaerolineae bacterium]|nr:LutB/LldF family L-lactate oxidation iron-sulfur protein [Anaerolineae bacterium]